MSWASSFGFRAFQGLGFGVQGDLGFRVQGPDWPDTRGT